MSKPKTDPIAAAAATNPAWANITVTAVGVVVAAAAAFALYRPSEAERAFDRSLAARPLAERHQLARRTETLRSLTPEEITAVRGLARSIQNEPDTQRRRLLEAVDTFETWSVGLNLPQRESVSPDQMLSDRKAAVERIVATRQAESVATSDGRRLPKDNDRVRRIAEILSSQSSTSGPADDDPLAQGFAVLSEAVKDADTPEEGFSQLMEFIRPVTVDIYETLADDERPFVDGFRNDQRTGAAAWIALGTLWEERKRRLATVDTSKQAIDAAFARLDADEQNALLELSQSDFRRQMIDRIQDGNYGPDPRLTPERLAKLRDAVREFGRASRRGPRPPGLDGPPNGRRRGGPPRGPRRGP